MSDEDLLVVESVAYDQLVRLGYQPHYPAIEHLEIDSTLEDKYTLENERLIRKMNEDLAEENPEDLRRRQIQGPLKNPKKWGNGASAYACYWPCLAGAFASPPPANKTNATTPKSVRSTRSLLS